MLGPRMVYEIIRARQLCDQARALRTYSLLLQAQSAELARTFHQQRVILLLRSIGITATHQPPEIPANDG
jgi:hypothetical protein